jgi:serine protease Do
MHFLDVKNAAFISAFALLLSVGVMSPHCARADAAPADSRKLLLQLQDNFTQIAKSAMPYVVNIKSSRINDAEPVIKRGVAPSPDQEPTQPGAPSDSPFPRRLDATGSGVIIREDGYIMTNDHVVEGSNIVTVTLSDGREFYGTVTTDHQSDLAVVKIDTGGEKLPYARFADSASVETGQWAIAIGSPFDLQNTMTVGFISATHRSQKIGAGKSMRFYPDLIQTDAAINPGNSGGPLFNANGEVVGINVAIESPVDVSAGVGFAIPTNIINFVVNSLIKNGKVTRGYLGLTPADLTPAKQKLYGVSKGAWVQSVDMDGPAGRAGVHAGDIVVSFDGKDMEGELPFRLAIMSEPPGTKVPVTLIRDGKNISLDVLLTDRPVEVEAGDGGSKPAVDSSANKIGISARNLTDTDRSQGGYDSSLKGALVVNVQPNSPAEYAGLFAGDVITRIDNQSVANAQDAAAALATLTPGQIKTIIVTRIIVGKTVEWAVDLKTWK